MNFTPHIPDLDLQRLQQIYFVGLKGVGMTSLAVLLQEAGKDVQGADVADTFVTDALLQSAGIPCAVLESATIPDTTELVIYSGAHQGRNNPLVQQAIARNIPAVTLAQAVGLVSRLKPTLVVSGVGGKSTTSALLSWMLESGGLRPSFSVGVGDIPNFGTSGRWISDSEYFVVEGDEYVADPKQDVTPRFLYLQPAHIICTSLNYDHPDVYASFEDTKQAFSTLFNQLPENGVLVYNSDNADLCELVNTFSESCKTLGVGEQPHADIQLTNLRVEHGVGMGTLTWKSTGKILPLECQIPGFHNLFDAAYAAVLASELGVADTAIQTASRSFASTVRRFESKGQTDSGTICFDDYAHHPREIEAVGQALQHWFPDFRTVIAFQPHTYSRTKALFPDFVAALASTQAEVLLLPIFASAREEFDDSITSDMLAEELQKNGTKAQLLSSQGELLQYVQSLSTKTVFITLGAGDIYSIYDQLTLIPTAASVSASAVAS